MPDLGATTSCHCGLSAGSFALEVAIVTSPFASRLTKEMLSMFSTLGERNQKSSGAFCQGVADGGIAAEQRRCGGITVLRLGAELKGRAGTALRRGLDLGAGIVASQIFRVSGGLFDGERRELFEGNFRGKGGESCREERAKARPRARAAEESGTKVAYNFHIYNKDNSETARPWQYKSLPRFSLPPANPIKRSRLEPHLFPPIEAINKIQNGKPPSPLPYFGQSWGCPTVPQPTAPAAGRFGLELENRISGTRS